MMLSVGPPDADPALEAPMAPTVPILYTSRCCPTSTMTLHPVEAFADNYIWVLDDGKRAVVVDPGDERPVLDYLTARNLQLDTILITHHHADHVGGVHALASASGAKVVGPAHEPLPVEAERVSHGDRLNLLGWSVEVLEVPGHTVGHAAFFMPDADRPLLFCGDTLFSAGCGRLFEGTPEQMLQSLDLLAALPVQTQVCAAHEYTLSNLRFALEVEPDNEELARYHADCLRLRDKGVPTLPTTIEMEKRINPFLRVREAKVTRRVMEHANMKDLSATGVFAALREWKNNYR